MVQNINKMVNALISADKMLTIMGNILTLLPAKRMKILPSIIKSGAPGGCPTSSLLAVAINSPQSQKLPVGSMVLRYVKAEMPKTIHPVMLFIFR